MKKKQNSHGNMTRKPIAINERLDAYFKENIKPTDLMLWASMSISYVNKDRIAVNEKYCDGVAEIIDELTYFQTFFIPGILTGKITNARHIIGEIGSWVPKLKELILTFCICALNYQRDDRGYHHECFTQYMNTTLHLLNLVNMRDEEDEGCIELSNVA